MKFMAGLLVFSLSFAFFCVTCDAQEIKVAKEYTLACKVKTHTPGLLTLINEKGDETVVKYQESDDSAVSLGGGTKIIRIPCKFEVLGRVPFSYVEEKMVLKFTAMVGRSKAVGQIDYVQLMPADSPLSIDFVGDEPEGGALGRATIVGKVRKYFNGKCSFDVPKSNYVPSSWIQFDVADDAVVDLKSNKLDNVQSGDEVTMLEAAELSTGDIVAKKIEVKLDGRRYSRSSFDAQLWRKYSDLPDKPTLPRTVRSRYFILRTDISPRSEKVLCDKLNQMVDLISGYYNVRPKKPIECYVVSIPPLWENSGEIHPYGMYKIYRREGVTITASLGDLTQSKVYSCDEHGVVQHEAVHAFCAETFGSPGPTWYAEGMAEVANYWKKDKLCVDIDPVVMDYLSNNKSPSIAELVRPDQKTGDSWQAYAWRWALCQMLVQNPNYSKEFKKLGLALMKKEEGASFEDSYGKVKRKIEFEYGMFSENLGNGYRIDLCAWDWDQNPQLIPPESRAKLTIDAQRGWQTTPIKVQQGVSYDVAALNEWKVEPEGQPVDANGNERGEGRLVCAVYNDYKLSDEIELGTMTTITPTTDGQLVFRCREKWTHLEDNTGELTVYVRRTPKE
jgi:hypothetical protein